MYPKILKGLSLGLSFQFFEYLGFEFEYLQNSKKIIFNNIIKNKKIIFEYGFEYQF
jgi:hypothetical protein